MATQQHSKQEPEIGTIGDAPKTPLKLSRKMIIQGYAAEYVSWERFREIGFCMCPRGADGTPQHVLAEVSA